MKKLIFLSALIAIGCGQEAKPDAATSKAEKPNVESRPAGNLKLAFYVQDSMQANFKFYTEQEAALKVKTDRFEQELARMSREVQEFYQRNGERERQGQLSQVQIQQLAQEGQRKQLEIQEYQEVNGRNLEKETMAALDAVGSKIESYSKMFCEENGIDVLLIKGTGGNIAFMSSAMDVSTEFVAFLNEKEGEITAELSGDK